MFAQTGLRAAALITVIAPMLIPITEAASQPRHGSAALSGGRHEARTKPGDGCLGASACNSVIADCIGAGYDFKPLKHNGEGQPTYGFCVERTD
jgi:hypothetical protein